MDEQTMRVWWIPQVPMEAFNVDVANLAEGVKIMDVLADYDAFQFENNVKGDYCNVGGIVVLDDDGEWVDWFDDETDEDNPRAFLEATK